MLREYVDRLHLPAARAYRHRAAGQGAFRKQVVDRYHDLGREWPVLRFGEVKVQTNATRHVFELQVHLGALPRGKVLLTSRTVTW